MKISDLVLAVRAYTVRQGARASAARKTASAAERWPRAVLVLDTETTVDAAQELLFGSYRYCSWTEAGSLACVQEGLFHADNLRERDPAGLRRLQRYVATHRAKVAPEGDHRLHLLSRAAFADRVLWPALKAGALIVGFNLPFDLARLATHCGEGRNRYRGGFSFRLWEFGRGRDHQFRPRIGIKHVDSKRSFMGVLRPARDDPANGLALRAHFLDLRTLAFVLTDRAYALDGACEDFGVEHGKLRTPAHGRITPAYVDYNRRDVLASSELLVKLRAEFDRHPIELDPCKALSPASIAKAYLRQMGIAPPSQQFSNLPPRLLGRAMSAYFGGRTECRVRNSPVPVVYLDFLSMYPTVNTLLGLWRMLTAESLHVTDATDEAQQLLTAVTLERCFDPATWSQLAFFAEVLPEGDVLPARARYTEGTDEPNIGVNPLTSSTPLWYPGPDLVAAALLTGKAPKVLRAFRLVPEGQQPGLRPVRLRGEVAIDPRHDDFFKRVIEERRRVRQGPETDRTWLDLFLKVLANAGSYGIFAEMNRNELADKDRCDITVYGLGSARHWRTHAPEELGPYCFPPLAALIPAGARLMLALLERCVTDQGGTYAFCDTDSMAVVASERGGLVPCPGASDLLPHWTPAVRALAWHEVEAIVAQFAALNPYDRSVVPGSVLKIEKENFDHGQRRQLYAYVISAKRYALFTQDSDEHVTIVKASEHGLGHLLNPADPDDPSRDWITAVWAFIVSRALGLACEEPPWLDQPAIGRVTISSPQLLRPFAPKGKRRGYARAVKPMNFLLSAQVARFGHPAGADPKHFHLMAPYTNDPRQWLKILWTDIHSGHRYAITTSTPSSGQVVRVKSYREVLAEYEVHPEPKSAAPDGSPSGPGTLGLLKRRAVRVAKIEHIGKEANRLEDVEAGWVHDLNDVVEVYGE